MSMTEEAKQIAKVRVSIYTLLSQWFMQPTKELVNSIIDGTLNDAFENNIGLTEDKKVLEKLVKLKDFSTQSKKLFS